MTRTYCDVCNKETNLVAEYMLPKRVPRYATDKAGNKIMPFGETVEPVKKGVVSKMLSFIKCICRWLFSSFEYGR